MLDPNSKYVQIAASSLVFASGLSLIILAAKGTLEDEPRRILCLISGVSGIVCCITALVCAYKIKLPKD